ncbi:subtilisin family serine protease [Caldalkalibacillus uzonensis]|uniref:Subtilisin family serine protease n=1 Tax=Caldalkalibacillus uzonensis TaxID=353224 RepID=A0ABU0CMV3_9BACI|nr:S8 family peptidase [Caldalkalibacillus uzonensis]MDQ0337746.1 subtilisin family serine protease [Caldalkalibacillus uzonensis]
MPRYIVKLRKGSLGHCCSVLNNKGKDYLLLKHINALCLSASGQGDLFELLGAEHIVRIDEDATVSLINTTETKVNQETPDRLWGLLRIGATFSGIPRRYPHPKVAVIDTGIDAHPYLRLSKKVVNFSDEKRAKDRHGHGTHLAGIIAGFSPVRNKKNAKRFHGVFPRLPLVNVKAFNKGGTSTISRIILALEWCIAENIRLVNMSFGLDQNHPALYEAIQACADKGMLMTAASGNGGRPGLKYPARYREVIAVGSINHDDQVSHFSQFGTDLDVVAPGEEICSTWRNGRFNILSGTSMACAHVTGTIALMLALKPDLTTAEIRHILSATCERLPTSFLLQGNGLINIKRMVQHVKE